MSEKIRLDRLMANMGLGSRKEVKALIRQGRVTINGTLVKSADLSVDTATDQVSCCGTPLVYEKYLYLMMNKPAGYVSANVDPRDPTVMALLDEPYSKMALFVAGRLDKDTEGLLILTNNGQFAHNMLAPKKHVPKTYYARIDGEVTDADVTLFQEGVTTLDDYHCQPAQLTILQQGPISEITLTIYEGKYHQVKRMFEAIGKPVLFLQRIQIGALPLDPALPSGAIRKLSASDLRAIGADIADDQLPE